MPELRKYFGRGAGGNAGRLRATRQAATKHDQAVAPKAAVVAPDLMSPMGLEPRPLLSPHYSQPKVSGNNPAFPIFIYNIAHLRYGRVLFVSVRRACIQLANSFLAVPTHQLLADGTTLKLIGEHHLTQREVASMSPSTLPIVRSRRQCSGQHPFVGVEQFM